MFKLAKLKLYIKDSAQKERRKTTANLLGRISLPKNAKHLDVGCHSGRGTAMNVKKMGIDFINVYGVDHNEEALRQAGALFNVVKLDIEQERLSYPDDYFDVVVISEVFEHLKNINFVFSEIYRVLKIDGFLLVSTPNLAALHNRILLLFGRQPRCINLFSGTHVRGFTLPSWKKLLPDKGFRILKIAGAGFYPLWGVLAKMVAVLFSSLAVYSIILAQKVSLK